MTKRLRALLLLRLGLVVALDVAAHPGPQLARHRHLVDALARVHPAPGLGVAHGEKLRHRALLVHAPQDEHARLLGRHVHVVAVGLVAAQLDLHAGIQPLRGRPFGHDHARAAFAVVVGQHADRLPGLALPAAGEGTPLHDHRHAPCRPLHVRDYTPVWYPFRLYTHDTEG